MNVNCQGRLEKTCVLVIQSYRYTVFEFQRSFTDKNKIKCCLHSIEEFYCSSSSSECRNQMKFIVEKNI